MTQPDRNRPRKLQQSGHTSTRNGQKALAVEGDTPLDYMLRVLNDPDANPRRKDRMAKAALPYCSRPAGTVASDAGGLREREQNERLASPLRSGGQYERFPEFVPTVQSSKVVTLERDATVRERMKRYRRRQRGGRLFASIEIAPEETARLNRLGYLRESELEDRDAIAAAIHALLGNIVDEP